MFRQPKKHAASTSSKWSQGGVLPFAALPVSFHLNGSYYTFYRKPIAPYEENGNRRLFFILFGDFGNPVEYPSGNNISGFELICEGYTFTMISANGTTINDELIQDAETKAENCEYFSEFLEYLKKYKGLACVHMLASTGIDTPDTLKIDVSWFGDVIVRGLEMPTSEDDILGYCDK